TARDFALHPDEKERADGHQVQKQKNVDGSSQRVRQPGPNIEVLDQILGHLIRPNRNGLHFVERPIVVRLYKIISLRRKSLFLWIVAHVRDPSANSVGSAKE